MKNQEQARRRLIWDENLGKHVEATEENIARLTRNYSGRFEWIAFRYKDQLELARQTRNALLAVQAELFRLHFQNWNKGKSIEVGTSTLRELGFSHHDKIRALKALESAGWIAVEWRKRKSPLVILIKGFRTGC